MRMLRRRLAVLGMVVALITGSVAVSGCGGAGHYLGAVAIHHVLNHVVTSAAGQRRLNKLFCLYHGHRVLVDARHHHYFAAGLNGLAALHACKRGFGHHT